LGNENWLSQIFAVQVGQTVLCIGHVVASNSASLAVIGSAMGGPGAFAGSLVG
jgi:hypothetical protein